MPTPPKPFEVLKTEKKSHRTKSELALREQGEKELSSKKQMKMQPQTKKNAVAAKEFKRVKKLLENINKDDALYESVINRYCIIKAEAEELEQRRDELYELIYRLEEKFENISEELSATDRAEMFLDFSREMTKLTNQVLGIDRDIQAKRKMLLDIEKENVMTVAAALRSIPKKTEQEDPLVKILKGS